MEKVMDKDDPRPTKTMKRQRSPSPRPAKDMTLYCCYTDEGRPFSVDIPASDSIGGLKNKISMDCSETVQPYELDLFNICLPNESQSVLVQKVKNKVKGLQPFTATTKINQIFPDGLPERTVHIAIQIVRLQPQNFPTTIAPPEGSRQYILEAAAERENPSTDAKLENFRDVQNNDQPDALYNHRPLELTAPPITIYHPVFSEFICSMSVPTEGLEFTHEELDTAVSLIIAGCHIYENESARRQGIYAALEGFVVNSPIDYHDEKNIRRSFTPDAFLRVSCSEMPGNVGAYSVIHEVENEIGEGASDPITQAECDYKALVTSKEYASIRDACCCPAFLIGIAGPNLTVSGAVFTDRLISQRLTDYIYLGPLPTDGSQSSPLDKRVRKVAQLLRAMKKTTAELKAFYSKLTPRLEDGGYHFPPHFNKYSVGQDNFQIKYLERLNGGSLGKAVYKAEEKNITSGATREVAVKFAYSYGKKGHELLASGGFAPSLRYCNRVESVAGMFVVVMDWVTGEHVPKVKDVGMIQSLREAVELLQKHGLVFGDLRAPNVLVKPEKTIMLVDFDWCGPAGAARYPSDLNMNSGSGSSPDTSGLWHPDAKRRGPITMEHDACMFHMLTGNRLSQ
ncbi:hypothetical protein K435DRAFT_744024 [Dendrothele bispora CBS 962.96]|uniref:Crinkler effector protein N-terminal domain-containing protein n=1 Tax=Dendrothele bispora (strain CBS 962.96) TaxID=1314807 RepID=A0A4S8MT27_DENBC|nr:hypothetical protein K435DRAFT_744024 [Dendrothele bispora CBS 962.96]